MAGLVFLADFFDWTAQEAVEAYIFRSDVQYALNLEPGVTGLLAHRRTLPEAVSRRRTGRPGLPRRDHPAGRDAGTRHLPPAARLDPRLFSHGQLRSHQADGRGDQAVPDPGQATRPRVVRRAARGVPRRYEPAESQLFAGAKDAEARQRSRQQAAEDLLWIIEHFAKCADMTGRSSYKALVTIFHQQCELSEGKVVVKAKTGGDCMQNPSDPDASYDAHKGQGYQVQIAETCSPENEVQLITGALPQTAAEPDGAAVVPMLDQLEESELLPEEMLADTLYGGDENVQAAEARGVELVAPIPGREPEVDPAALTLDDFAVDERTGQVEACPQRAHAAGGRAGRGSGHDATSRWRRRSVGDARSARPARSTRLGTAATRWSSPTRTIAWLGGGGNKRLRCSRSGTRRVGHRVDQQRLEESAGIGAAEGAGSRERVPCDPAQSGGLERAAGGGVEEAARLGEEPGGPDAQRGGVWAE